MFSVKVDSGFWYFFQLGVSSGLWVSKFHSLIAPDHKQNVKFKDCVWII